MSYTFAKAVLIRLTNNVRALRADLLIAAALAGFIFVGCSSEEPNRAAPGQEQKVSASLMPETHFPERLAQIGPQACVECHADIVAEWQGTHHADANRPTSTSLDSSAFSPPRVLTDGEVITQLERQSGNFVMRVDEADGSHSEHLLTGVIGVDPLRQYLTRFPDGQWQTTSVAYDPHADEWFEVFSEEDRLPGEWGHWSGQGMNWNANCATCHMTEYKKNYDWRSGQYASTWLQQGISCAQCHNGLEAHVANASKPGYVVPAALKASSQQILNNCATCHSRRDELTDNDYRPGDPYHQHYDLALPDQPGLYYPDGQIRDEVFVTGSFQMSRMGHAGVTCLDCHNPHSLDLILPAQDNSLCLRCHSSGLQDAPIIEPTAHSHHPAGSTGNQCIECHMPHTTYMQRDPRRDHGFLSPDPLLTRELGIPNACNNCHTDESVEWAIEWSEEWYGEKLAAMPQRERARAIAAAYNGEAQIPVLLELAGRAENPTWRATYTGLLAPYASDPRVQAFMQAQLDHDSPMVRSRAVRALGQDPQSLGAIYPMMEDTSRSVRLAATNAFVGRTPQMPQEAVEEWRDYHRFNSDRPQDAFILASDAIRSGQAEEARLLIERAIDLDRLNSQVRQQAAILYSQLGDPESAEAELLAALESNPDDAQSLYYLALLRAEADNYPEAIALLRDATAADPEFYRAWYNLALAYTKVEDWVAASEALERAAPGMRWTRPWQQVRRMIDQQL